MNNKEIIQNAILKLGESIKTLLKVINEGGTQSQLTNIAYKVVTNFDQVDGHVSDITDEKLFTDTVKAPLPDISKEKPIPEPETIAKA